MPEGPFRSQLGEPHHYANVVADIKATVGRVVEALGAGPFFLIEGVPLENVRSRGQAAEFAHNSAFGSCGDGVIELIEPIRLAPERVEKGFSGSRPRAHHDASAVLGHDMEIHVDNEGLNDFVAMVRGGAEGWDGAEPLRRVET